MKEFIVKYIDNKHYDTITIRRKAESEEDLIEKLKDLFIISIYEVKFELNLNAIY